MKKLFLKSFFLILIIISNGNSAQCIAPNPYGSSTCNNAGAFTITSCNYAGEYSNLTLNFAGTYTFGSSNPADYLTLTQNGQTVAIATGTTPIVVTLTNTGAYNLHVSNPGFPTCGTDVICRTTSYTVTGLPGSPSVITQPVDRTACVGNTIQYSVAATPSNVNYQWQVNQGGGFNNVVNGGVYSGATTATLTLAGITGTMNGFGYRCVVSNTVSSVNSFSAILNVINNGAMPLMETFNGNLAMPALWINNPISPWYVTANHGTGGTNGMNVEMWFIDTLAEALTVKVGPATASTSISFDYRFVDWTGYPANATSLINIGVDSLNLYVSTNCGNTFTLLGSRNASNHTVTTNFYNVTYTLGGFAGNDLVFKFKGRHDPNGPGDYYMDIDNVNVYNLMANDAGVNNFVSPAANQPCYGNNVPVTVQVRNYGINTISNFPVTTQVSGQLTQTLTSTFTGTLAPGASTSFVTGTLNMGAPGVYNFKSYTSLGGDPVNGNDTLLPVVSRTVIATGTVPYSQNFNAGLTMPQNWVVNPGNPFAVMANHGTNNSNGISRNLYGTFNAAEVNMPVMGPITSSTAISFDYRLVNWSGYPSTATPTVDLIGDSLKLMASTNCGLTYTTIGLVTVANHIETTSFATKTYTLGGLAGNNVVFKFHAVRTPTNSSDYYVDVDNINLFNMSPIDPGISALNTPSVGGCYSATQAVNVNIQNFGTGTLTGIPVSVIISGPVNQTITATYNGTLAVGATTAFTVGNANMSLAGVYTFSCSTNMPGDGNVNNDLFVTTRTVTPNVYLISPGSICLGGSATLTASGANSYTWSTGSNSVAIVVTPSITTTYSVAGTGTNGCTAAQIVTLTVLNPTISSTGTVGCGNPAYGTLTANAFTPSTISWFSSPTSTVVLGTGSMYPINSSSTTTVYAEANSVSNNSLFTTLIAGNGSTGNMFNVTSANSLTLNAVDMHFNSNTTSTVEVWYRAGSFVGFENSNVGWTLAHTATVTPLGTGTLTPIPGTFAINVAPGQTVGLYVTSNGGSGVNYTNGTGLGNLYVSNSDLQIYEGKGGSYFGVVNSPRVFNGALRYNKQGCNSPRVASVFTVVPGLTVTAIGSNSSVCTGSAVTLTAGGAQNYTWSPSGDITPTPNASVVAASPTSNTTYTLLGNTPACPQTSSTTINITVIQGPTLNVSPPTYILPGSLVTLTVSGANSYSWMPGGSNNNNIIVQPVATTVYSVTGTNANGCTSIATTTVFISAVGLQEISASENAAALYPNPTSGHVSIEFEKMPGNCIFEVTDISGRVVYKSEVKTKLSTYTISHLSNGLYTYTVKVAQDGRIIKTGKLVKQN